jgi:hypothetical protein
MKFVIYSFHRREVSTNTDICTLEINVTNVTVGVFVEISEFARSQCTDSGE